MNLNIYNIILQKPIYFYNMTATTFSRPSNYYFIFIIH